MRRIRYGFLALLLFGMTPAPAAGQSNATCDLVLWRAQRQYDSSRFRDVIAQFETCLPENIADPKERIEAYKLLALAWIGEEKSYMARQYAEKIRELDPLYEPEGAVFSRYYLELFKPSDAKQEIALAVEQRDLALLRVEEESTRAMEFEALAASAGLEAAEADSLARIARFQAEQARLQVDALTARAALARVEARAADSLRIDATLRASRAEAEADSAEALAARARQELEDAATQLEVARASEAIAAETLAAAMLRAQQAEAAAQLAEQKLTIRRRRIATAAVGAGILGGVIAWIVKPGKDQNLPIPPPFPSPAN
ncbi:MAG: hypothetical protein SH809_18325 [Rhodothermales bacterium]|nr:hypothetical protein [Rhodothermales bacterium]